MCISQSYRLSFANPTFLKQPNTHETYWITIVPTPKKNTQPIPTSITIKYIQTQKTRKPKMTQEQTQEYIDKIHAQNHNWEVKGDTYSYAHKLWSGALNCIEDHENIEKEKRAIQTYQILHYTGSLAKCLTDNFRRLIIRHHARGLTTSQTIDLILPDEMLKDVTPFHVFKFENVCGYDNIKNFLLMRVSYLKPTNPRWPHKKYGEYWKKERTEYLEMINDVPFTHTKEQIATLYEHYTILQKHLATAADTIEIERLHRCKLQTIAAINILNRTTDIDIHQQTLFQKNMTKLLLDAISGATTENRIQNTAQKQLEKPEKTGKQIQ